MAYTGKTPHRTWSTDREQYTHAFHFPLSGTVGGTVVSTGSGEVLSVTSVTDGVFDVQMRHTASAGSTIQLTVHLLTGSRASAIDVHLSNSLGFYAGTSTMFRVGCMSGSSFVFLENDPLSFVNVSVVTKNSLIP